MWAMTVVTLRTSRRSRPSPRRREPEIIEAAARVFAERGFHGATTQDIADVLGIRQAACTTTFPPRRGALELVCLQGVGGFFEVAKAIASGPGTAADKLTRLIKSHLSPLTDRSDFVRVFPERAPVPAAREPPADRKMVARTGAGVRKRSQEGVRRGEFRTDLDTRLAVLGILGMANAVANWYRAEEVAIDRVSAEFARLLVGGGGKTAQATARLNCEAPLHALAEIPSRGLRFAWWPCLPPFADALGGQVFVHATQASPDHGEVLGRHAGDRAAFRRDRARDHARDEPGALAGKAHDHLAAIGRGPRARHQAHSDEAADHARKRRNVDAGHGSKIDLALAVVARERGENPPHRDAQPVWSQRAPPEINHQRRADAIDQVGKIFGEIELRAAGHERKIPERIGAGKLLWASSHDVKAPALTAHRFGA
jgi:AcrR family transcriptional regulator